MDLKSKIILIAGPTASGKTKFAIKLAKKLNGEIINSDSMQIYKELKILTARPNEKEKDKIKHHLYGFLTVKKNFSTGSWLRLVKKKIQEIKKRNKTPILVGGTGLYFKSLTDGLVKIPNIPLKHRYKIRKIHNRIGQKNFYKKLSKLDPACIKKIDKTDSQRSIRAYEIKSFTKKSVFDWYKNTKPIYKNENFFKIYIDYPRKELLQKIEQRTSKMIKEGAIREVDNFLNLKIREDNTSNKVIGIKEIEDHLKKQVDIKQVEEKITIKTRQYAKRQSTWARGQMENWQKFKPKDLRNFLKKI